MTFPLFSAILLDSTLNHTAHLPSPTHITLHHVSPNLLVTAVVEVLTLLQELTRVLSLCKGSREFIRLLADKLQRLIRPPPLH